MKIEDLRKVVIVFATLHLDNFSISYTENEQGKQFVTLTVDEINISIIDELTKYNKDINFKYIIGVIGDEVSINFYTE